MLALLLFACDPTPSTPTPSEADTDTDTDTDADTDADTDSDADSDTAFLFDTGPYEPGGDVDWVPVPAGTFEIGSPAPSPNANETPQRTITLPSFAMMRHEVRVADHTACVDAGHCAEAPSDGNCLGLNANPELPRNCLDYAAAAQVCAWLGGRLPSESEWEYVASSLGQPNTFPWGEDAPSCERSNVLFDDGSSCPGGLWEVCTHPQGNTTTGFCDMGGNAFEWVADWFRDDYVLLPDDGSPETVMLFEFRSMRGGGVGSAAPPRVRQRTFHPPDFLYGGMGVRCAMDL